jgi:hypothetical protein
MRRPWVPVARPEHDIGVFQPAQKISNVLRAMLEVDIQGDDAPIPRTKGVLETGRKSSTVALPLLV